MDNKQLYRCAVCGTGHEGENCPLCGSERRIPVNTCKRCGGMTLNSTYNWCNDCLLELGDRLGDVSREMKVLHRDLPYFIKQYYEWFEEE